jgi:hypothetical protein
VCGSEHIRLEHAAPGCNGLTDTELQALGISVVHARRSGAS